MIEIYLKKKSYAEIARLYGKNEFSIREVMNKKKIVLVFLLHRRLQKLLLLRMIKC